MDHALIFLMPLAAEDAPAAPPAFFGGRARERRMRFPYRKGLAKGGLLWYNQAIKAQGGESGARPRFSSPIPN